MQKRATQSLLALTTGLMLAGSLAAEELKVQEMCDKVKECALETFAGQDIPDQMRDVLISNIDAQCATGLSENVEKIKEAGLVKKSNACVDSMVASSCDSIMKTDGEVITPECEDFRKSAKEAGLDVN